MSKRNVSVPKAGYTTVENKGELTKTNKAPTSEETGA